MRKLGFAQPPQLHREAGEWVVDAMSGQAYRVTSPLRRRVWRGSRVGNSSAEEIRAPQDGAHRVTLDAYGYQWLRLGDTNQALARTIID